MEKADNLLEEYEKITATAYVDGYAAYLFNGEITNPKKDIRCLFNGEAICRTFISMDEVNEWVKTLVGVDKVLVENNSPYVHGCTTINLK